jgi:hypothetical protein
VTLALNIILQRFTKRCISITTLISHIQVARGCISIRIGAINASSSSSLRLGVEDLQKFHHVFGAQLTSTSHSWSSITLSIDNASDLATPFFTSWPCIVFLMCFYLSRCKLAMTHNPRRSWMPTSLNTTAEVLCNRWFYSRWRRSFKGAVLNSFRMPPFALHTMATTVSIWSGWLWSLSKSLYSKFR